MRMANALTVSEEYEVETSDGNVRTFTGRVPKHALHPAWRRIIRFSILEFDDDVGSYALHWYHAADVRHPFLTPRGVWRRAIQTPLEPRPTR